MKDVKQKHQQKFIEQKIEEQKKKEEERYIASVMEEKKYDWRKELIEQMTTSDIFSYSLPEVGDVDLNYPGLVSGGGHNSTISGDIVTISGNPSPFLSNGIILNFDSSQYDTLKFNVNMPSGNFLGFFLGANNSLVRPDLLVTSSGTYTLNVPQSKNLSILIDTPDSATMTLSSFSFQRRTPLSVFVSLDSPEASSFIRTDPIMQGLSADERRKKLEDMLDAGNEYLLKALGMTGNKFEFADTGNVRGWEQAADNEIAQLSPSDYNQERQIDQILLKGLRRGDYGTGPAIDKQIQNILKNMQQKTPGGLPQAQADQDTQIAADYTNQDGQRVLGPHTDVKYDRQMKMYVPAKPRPGALPVRVAHYEPQGQVISEKKLRSPKEVMNKIPGYYDGKPSPLGFPDNPPPEMVNGFHPDLVGGKKVADRFNRLDPESARAMPSTGNPHIDTKVRAAAKKPK